MAACYRTNLAGSVGRLGRFDRADFFVRRTGAGPELLTAIVPLAAAGHRRALGLCRLVHRRRIEQALYDGAEPFAVAACILGSWLCIWLNGIRTLTFRRSHPSSLGRKSPASL